MGPNPLASVPYGWVSMVGLLWGLMAYGDRPAPGELTNDDWKALGPPRPFDVGVPPLLPPELGEMEGPVITVAVGVIDEGFAVSVSSGKEIKRRNSCNYITH